MTGCKTCGRWVWGLDENKECYNCKHDYKIQKIKMEGKMKKRSFPGLGAISKIKTVKVDNVFKRKNTPEKIKLKGGK
jgi:hypothetical protein